MNEIVLHLTDEEIELLRSSMTQCYEFAESGTSKEYCDLLELKIANAILDSGYPANKKLPTGLVCRINVETVDWGRVTGDGRIIKSVGKGLYLINAFSIKENILVKREEICICQI